MDIAIIKNDSVMPELRNRFPDYDQMILDWIAPLNPSRITIYDMQKLEKPTYNHDLYISSGSRANVYEDLEWIKHYQEIVKDLHEKKRLHFGICFGHEMIALALGGKVAKSRNGWGIGMHKWEVVDNKILSIPQKSLSLAVSHQDQVVEMTSDMNLFLTSDFCPVAGFTVGNHIMTVQGHPEFSSSYVDAIMEKRKEIYPPHVYQQGKKSLTLPAHKNELLLIIKKFFLIDSV